MQIDKRLRECGSGPACPAAYSTDTARWLMQGPRIDAATRPEIVVPSHEGLVEVTPDVIDLIRRQPFMDIEQLGAWIMDHHEHDAFRLERLSRYVVPSDEPDFDAFMRGEPGPDMDAKQGWLDWLATVAETGRTWRNVHIIDEWTPYLAFEFAWCYPDNVAAGADVRIIDLTETEIDDDLRRLDDFYVVDGLAAVVGYDKAGYFLYALPVDRAERLIEARDRLWDAAIPFTEWWRTHPDRHRVPGRAA